MRHTIKHTMNLPMAWAVATDAANKRMRRDGRRIWNQADYRFAVKLVDRLCPDPEK